MEGEEKPVGAQVEPAVPPAAPNVEPAAQQPQPHAVDADLFAPAPPIAPPAVVADMFAPAHPQVAPAPPAVVADNLEPPPVAPEAPAPHAAAPRRHGSREVPLVPIESVEDLPIAARRTPRNVGPPGEWYKVKPREIVVPESDDEEDDDEDDELAARVHLGDDTQPDPRTLAEALARPDAKKWREAADDEIEAHVLNGTWETCRPPPGANVLSCGWVLLKKYLADGSLERRKARLVVKGCGQRPGFDYIETFAPTVRMASIRTVLALSATEDLYLRSIDISHAFINGKLEEEIYMRQPEGYHFGNPGDVLRLRKSLYGLKQAPRVWNQTLHKKLKDLGFKRCKSDPSLYIYARGDVRIIVPIFIDDITISSTSVAEADKLVAELAEEFELRDLGETSYLLGIEIIRDRPNRSISLSQRQYIVDMLAQFKFSNCSAVTTPMEPGLHLTKAMCATTPEEIAEMRKVPYINAVGALMYLAVTTRPDIAYTTSTLARFNSNPGRQHCISSAI